ncbi:hypothetical protein [Candidatus Pantoea formicae]|uniref:hypothetical protein n=1 Tax=Candidatus Pantoea formicae TaxID=2608355 RepID=UPI003ED8E000
MIGPINEKKSINYIITALLALPFISFSSENQITINSKNNIQGIYLAKGKQFYTLEHESNDHTPRIFLNSENSRKLIVSDFDISHQGFSALQGNNEGDYYIWTGDKRSPYDCILFIIKRNSIVNKITFHVFDSSFYPKNETMPTVSFGNNEIIFRGRKSPREMILRKYSIRELINLTEYKNADFYDVSNKYISQIKLPPYIFTEGSHKFKPLQAISYSDHRIYLLLGDARINNKSLFVFSDNGDFICKNTTFHTGIAEAKKYINDNTYEPEGLSTYKNKISVLFSIAKNENRKNIIFTKTNDICKKNITG